MEAIKSYTLQSEYEEFTHIKTFLKQRYKIISLQKLGYTKQPWRSGLRDRKKKKKKLRNLTSVSWRD